MALLLANIAADLFVAGIEIAYLDELGAHPAHEPFDPINVEGSDIASAYDRSLIASNLKFAIYLATAVVFLMWFSRAYGNLPALGARNPRFSFGMAVWSWFVPIFNFIRPKQIANDIWRASDPDDLNPSWSARPVSPIVHWWWAVWVGVALVGSLGVPALLSSNTVADQKSLATTNVVTSGFDIVAAILAIFVVRAITEHQERRALRTTPPPSSLGLA